MKYYRLCNIPTGQIAEILHCTYKTALSKVHGTTDFTFCELVTISRNTNISLQELINDLLEKREKEKLL